MLVKLCGLRRIEDVDMVNRARPDYAGFVFAPGRRQVAIGQAAALTERLSPAIGAVGVFVNATPKNIAETARLARLRAVQLHGDETAAQAEALRALLPPGVEVWRAVRVRSAADIAAAAAFPCDRLLLDAYSPAAYGGTGVEINLSAVAGARAALCVPFLLAGGLHAGNVATAVAAAAPDGVDVSSGIETDGFKDENKIRALMRALGRVY